MTATGGEEERLALVRRERLTAVIELVLDAAFEDEAPMAVAAPLLALRAELVRDDRRGARQSPARAPGSPDVVVPVDRRERNYLILRHRS